MKAFKVNADYESVLFRGQRGASVLNHTIEFLYFFLEDDPLLTDKNYAPDYLEYVARLSGRVPRPVSVASEIENWWGLQKDEPCERWWNSKITSAEFLLTKGWINDLHVLRSDKDLESLKSQTEYLIKDPFLMSGQKFQINRGKVNWNKEKILLAEPLLQRVKDFSTYIYPDGKKITYENIVDQKFQYKGSLFSNIHDPSLKNLSFFSQLEDSKWEVYLSQLEDILNHYSRYPNKIGFSIDSFIYIHDGLSIHPLCEVNYRRTMGRIAYELGLRYGKGSHCVGFFLTKTGEQPLWKKYKDQNGITVFSPGDSRFEIFMVYGESREEVKSLLAYTQSAIDI